MRDECLALQNALKNFLTCWLWLALALAGLVLPRAAVADEPSFIGRVRLRGEPPPEMAIEMDAESMKLHRDPPKTRNYVVGPGRGLADVFVYIREKIPGPYRQAKDAVTMRIVGSQYEPRIVGLRTGQPLKIFNDDPFAHNCHSMPGKGHEVNSALPAGSTPLEWQFDEPELFIRLKCDAHPWEYGYVCVMDQPFFAVTGPDGRFSFPPGMPDGTFTIEAVHQKLGKLQRKVVFENDSAESIDFVFQAKAAEPRETKAAPAETKEAKAAAKEPKMELKETETEPPPPAAATEPAAPAPVASSDPSQAPGVVVHSSSQVLAGNAALPTPVEPDDSKFRWLIAGVMFALGLVLFRASKS